MEQLPDAPWIRDAELNGYPADDPVKCPVCGEETDTLYEANNGEIFGCDHCVRMRDAYEWQEEQIEQSRGDDW